MSGTMRGSKAPGYEYWSRRPGKLARAGLVGRDSKRDTHKAERRQGKKASKEQP